MTKKHRSSRTKWPLVVAAVLMTGSALAQTSATDPSEAWAEQIERANDARRKGKFADAESYYRAALKDSESFHPTDPRRAKVRNNLAALMHDLGRYADAAPLYQEALVLWRQYPGGEADLATTLNNLGELYRQQGRLDDAEAQYRRAIE